MLHGHAVLLSAVMAGLWPAPAAYATDFSLRPPSDVAGSPLQQAQADPNSVHSAPGLRPEGRAAGLRLDAEVATPSLRHDEARSAYFRAPVTAQTGSRDFRHEASIGTASASVPPPDPENGSAGLSAGESKLKLSRAAYAPRPGWEVSGRVGPLRWLTPIDGEGEKQVRLGGRLPGQPRMPGMGLFNIGIHYNFE
jgi:hypothetical protein